MSETPNPPEPRPRNPDIDLAIAFFGSIFVGIVSGYVGCLLAGLSLRGSGAGCILGTITGLPWGILTVIVAATAGAENRARATIWMFAILGIGLVVVTNVLLWYASFGA